MPNKPAHRIFGVIFVLIFFFLKGSSYMELIIAGIIGFFTSAGTPWDKNFGFSPDVDIHFMHRNFITHSALLPYIIFLISGGIWKIIATAWTFAWASHVILDYVYSKKQNLAGLIISIICIILIQR